MKSRLACWIVASFLMITGLTQVRAQSVHIDLFSEYGNAGSTVQMFLYLESSGGVHPAGIQVDVGFNTSVLTYGKISRAASAVAAEKSVFANLTAPGNLRVLVAGVNQTLIDDGYLAMIEFQIAANAPVSTTTVTLAGAVATTLAAAAIPSTSGSGLVVIGGGIANPSLLFFSQIADGNGYGTSFVLVNPGDTAVSAILELFKPDGTLLRLRLNGNTDSSFAVTLPAHGLALLESSGAGSIQTGWARVRSSAVIGGSIVYAYSTAPGNEVSEAGIDPSIPTNAFAISVDTRRGFLSGVALANPNATAVTLELTLYSRTGGAPLSRQTRSLAAMNQIAMLADQIFPNDVTANFTGMMSVSSTGGRIIGTTLRFNSDLSVFSSIPVINLDAGAATAELYFPQVADGAGFSTTFVLLNPGSTAITANLELFQASGAALPMNLNGTVGSSFNIPIPARGLVILESSNAATLRAGWAHVSASGPIGGSIIYGYSSPLGNTISEAGINPTSLVTGFSLSVDTRAGFLSGLAIANPRIGSTSLTLTLYDRSGNQVRQTTRSLAGLRYFAELTEQIFPGVNLSDFTGVIVVTSTGGRIIGTTLRFYPDMTVFASIPVL